MNLLVGWQSVSFKPTESASDQISIIIIIILKNYSAKTPPLGLMF